MLCIILTQKLSGWRVDFFAFREITFEVPDMETFRGLPMAIQAYLGRRSMPTVFNAANELAVKKFLEEKIGFLDIGDYCTVYGNII